MLEVAERLPELKIVINHLGRPPIPERGWEPWATQIARAAEHRNIAMKLSIGLDIIVRWRWSTGAIQPYCDHVLDLFSPNRVMAASNWPVILLGASYRQAWDGVTDLVRISDARMSGTSYGAVVLHVAPESAVGGPLALVRDGDRIRLDVDARSLDLLVDDAELARRRADWTPPSRKDERGYRRLYVEHVLQANQGCDFGFLCGRSRVVADTLTYL